MWGRRAPLAWLPPPLPAQHAWLRCPYGIHKCIISLLEHVLG